MRGKIPRYVAGWKSLLRILNFSWALRAINHEFFHRKKFIKKSKWQLLILAFFAFNFHTTKHFFFFFLLSLYCCLINQKKVVRTELDFLWGWKALVTRWTLSAAIRHPESSAIAIYFMFGNINENFIGGQSNKSPETKVSTHSKCKYERERITFSLIRN